MQHRVDAILAQDVLEVPSVADLAHDQARPLDDRRSVPRGQVVVDDDVVVGVLLEDHPGKVAADKAGSAGDH